MLTKQFKLEPKSLKYHPDEWINDCSQYWSRTLIGLYAHYCFDWDLKPIDETLEEFKYCLCNKETIKQSNLYAEEVYMEKHVNKI